MKLTEEKRAKVIASFAKGKEEMKKTEMEEKTKKELSKSKKMGKSNKKKEEAPKAKECYETLAEHNIPTKSKKPSRLLQNLIPGAEYHKGIPKLLPHLFQEYGTEYGAAAALGISIKKYERWLDTYDEFLEAHMYCKTKFKGWYFKYLIDNFDNQSINTGLIIFFGKSYFKLTDAPEKEEERERKTTELVDKALAIVDDLSKRYKKDY